MKLPSVVTQECQISPSLFNLFKYDLVQTPANLDSHPLFIDNPPINMLLYADDIALLRITPMGLQKNDKWIW